LLLALLSFSSCFAFSMSCGFALVLFLLYSLALFLLCSHALLALLSRSGASVRLLFLLGLTRAAGALLLVVAGAGVPGRAGGPARGGAGAAVAAVDARVRGSHPCAFVSLLTCLRYAKLCVLLSPDMSQVRRLTRGGPAAGRAAWRRALSAAPRRSPRLALSARLARPPPLRQALRHRD
jgi:hypothetical protein